MPPTHPTHVSDRIDYLLVGGGLQNGLIAVAIRAHQPSARIVMIERGAAPGGNHTWCFHAGDVPAGAGAWIDPLVTVRWDGYDVAFPTRQRRLHTPYACVSSERLAERVTAALAVPGSRLLLHTNVEHVDANRVVVRDASGTSKLIASAVIDARGPDRAKVTECGWQKFLGQELVLSAPHGLDRPMLMDATVPQRDGFRFMYVLPLAADRVLVEDTYFSDGTYLDVEAIRAEIAAYVAARGWSATCVREETGVLPMPWQLAAPSPTAPLVAGYAGSWFHPVTGYSFPIAARLAAFIAARPASKLFGAELVAFADAHARQLAFAQRLCRMMFRWFSPAQRHHVLARFYRLPDEAIRRFYALELTTMDRARIFAGAPPRGMSWRAVLGMEAR
jgi:lycopene beta-cyclase